MSDGVALADRPSAVVLMAGMLGVFAARPLLSRLTGDPTVALVALFSVLLAVGVGWPLARAAAPAPGGMALVVVAVGVGAFAIGRVVGGGHAPGPFTLRFLALNTLAAVAEEAFFRRFVYGLLERGGGALAVFGSALLFGVAHVTVYGWWVFPLDVAAGLVLAWQRWAGGSWVPPAITHAVANALVVL